MPKKKKSKKKSKEASHEHVMPDGHTMKDSEMKRTKKKGMSRIEAEGRRSKRGY